MLETHPISLIIPSYRRGVKIAPTLESVFAQTHIPEEVMVINDGGFSETSEYVLRHFPMVRVHDIPHGGAPAARNFGAAVARHPVLMLLDDDDTIRPHAVETLLRVLTTFPLARAAYADHSQTNHITGNYHANHHTEIPSFGRLQRVQPLRAAGSVKLYGKALYQSLLWGNLLQQPWMIYRDIYLELGGYKSGLGSADDWDLYLRLTRSHPIALSDEVIGDHFVETDKPHLTLASGQLESQMEAIRRQLRLAGWRDPKAALVLHRRLGIYHKIFGDRSSPSDLKVAWRCYLRSFLNWPFDHVVAARLLMWPGKILAGYRPVSSPTGSAHNPPQ